MDERPKIRNVSLKEAETFQRVQQTNPTVVKRVIYSYFPCDAHDCPCQKLISDLQHKFEGMTPKQVSEYKFKTEYLRCPKDKSDMKRYRIYCSHCSSLVGELYATDRTLVDYCDFHYISEHDGEYWYGAFGVNISPIDGHIGIECACGNDSRDFRANGTLPEIIKQQKIKEASFGREFNKDHSRYKVIPVDL